MALAPAVRTLQRPRVWVAGTSPAMTTRGVGMGGNTIPRPKPMVRREPGGPHKPSRRYLGSLQLSYPRCNLSAAYLPPGPTEKMTVGKLILAATVGVLLIIFGALRALRRSRKTRRSWLARKLDLPPPEFQEKFLRDWDYAQIDDWRLFKADPNEEEVKEAITLFDAAPEEAFHALLGLAALGSVWSMLWVAWCYHGGKGVPSDAALSEEWYQRAFQAGSQRGLLEYGRLKATHRDFDACEAVFSVGAENGWAPAQYWLACARVWKSRTPATLRRVRPLLESAIAGGSPAAKWFLGFYMSRGWFGLRAIPAGFRLVVQFSEETRKIVEAIYAADRGKAGDQYQLGWIYAFGADVARNDAKAIEMFNLAIAQGDAKAMLAKGWMHAYGRGVTYDPVQTYILTTLAMDRLPETDIESRDVATQFRDWAKSCLNKAEVAKARRIAKKKMVPA